jgi:type VI secretion system Hcp family effector
VCGPIVTPDHARSRDVAGRAWAACRSSTGATRVPSQGTTDGPGGITVAVSAFLSFFDEADGEATVKGHEKWVEIQGWDWDIEADSSWTKGGGATVGKPSPGALGWVHHFDASSPTIMGYLCTGKAFPKVQIDVVDAQGKGASQPSITMLMEGVFVTKVSTSMGEDALVVQRVEMVFKSIRIEYRAGTRGGALAGTFSWDIPSGTASPSA